MPGPRVQHGSADFGDGYVHLSLSLALCVREGACGCVHSPILTGLTRARTHTHIPMQRGGLKLKQMTGMDFDELLDKCTHTYIHL